MAAEGEVFDLMAGFGGGATGGAAAGVDPSNPFFTADVAAAPGDGAGDGAGGAAGGGGDVFANPYFTMGDAAGGAPGGVDGGAADIPNPFGDFGALAANGGDAMGGDGGLNIESPTLAAFSDPEPAAAPAPEPAAAAPVAAAAPTLAAAVPADVSPNYTAAYPYAPKEDDELGLSKGDLLHVSDVGPDGWMVGFNINTGKTGTFPGNFVAPLVTEATASDAEIARKLQAEEDARGSIVTASLDSDEALARRLQEEEDQRLALRAQQSEQSAAAAAAVTSRQPAAPLQGHGSVSRAAPKRAARAPRMVGYGEDYEGFHVRFMGSLKVEATQSASNVIAAIREIMGYRRSQKVKTNRVFHLQVSPRGIRLVDETPIKKRLVPRPGKRDAQAEPRRGVVSNFPLKNIAFCAYDPQDHKMFGFISKQPGGPACACHVFQFDKSAAMIANAVGRAFKAASSGMPG